MRTCGFLKYAVFTSDARAGDLMASPCWVLSHPRDTWALRPCFHPVRVPGVAERPWGGGASPGPPWDPFPGASSQTGTARRRGET